MTDFLDKANSLFQWYNYHSKQPKTPEAQIEFDRKCIHELFWLLSQTIVAIYEREQLVVPGNFRLDEALRRGGDQR